MKGNVHASDSEGKTASYDNNNSKGKTNMKYRYPGLQKANKTLLNYITYGVLLDNYYS